MSLREGLGVTEVLEPGLTLHRPYVPYSGLCATPAWVSTYLSTLQVPTFKRACSPHPVRWLLDPALELPADADT